MSIKEHPPQDIVRDDLHVPVLLDETLRLLDPKLGETYLDLTAGYAGHSSRVLEKTDNYDNSVLVDRDENAILHLQSFGRKGVTLLHTDFLSAAQQLVEQGRKFDMILVDLGVSSPQLDEGQRGFSFRHDSALDMRMDRRQELTADILVNKAGEAELYRIIREYGEEPPAISRRIAQAIVRQRPIASTGQLADIIKQAYRSGYRKTHPATRTFQALRMAVNDELGQIENLMPLLPRLLNKAGRVGVISFHSLEDRIVKRYFQEQARSGFEAELDIVNKKPIDGATYDVHNPRSRSAKLRVAVKK